MTAFPSLDNLPAPVAPTQNSNLKESAQPRRSQESVLLTSAADIEPECTDWLWNGWLAYGKLHLLAGSPGVSKTTLAMTLAATISNGGQFPDGSIAKRGKGLIWTSEDDPKDVLLPRLIAAGADRNNIRFVQGVNHSRTGNRNFDPSKDFPLLKEAIQNERDISFMVIDSIADAVSGDGAKNNQVRRALSPLKTFSEEMRIATLGITHFNKNISGKAISRIIDSVAFVGLPRVVMVAFKKRNNGSLIMRAKSNIGPDSGGYSFDGSMEPLRGYPMSAWRIRWGEYVEGTADEHLVDAESADTEPTKEIDRAEQWLTAEFSDGCRRRSDEIEALAKAEGISAPTMRRAKQQLGYPSKKYADGWYILPPSFHKNE